MIKFDKGYLTLPTISSSDFIKSKTRIKFKTLDTIIPDSCILALNVTGAWALVYRYDRLGLLCQERLIFINALQPNTVYDVCVDTTNDEYTYVTLNGETIKSQFIPQLQTTDYDVITFSQMTAFTHISTDFVDGKYILMDFEIDNGKQKINLKGNTFINKDNNIIPYKCYKNMEFITNTLVDMDGKFYNFDKDDDGQYKSIKSINDINNIDFINITSNDVNYKKQILKDINNIKKPFKILLLQ